MADVESTRMEEMAAEVESAVRSERHRGVLRYVLWALVVLGIAGAIAWWQWPREESIEYHTAGVDRGDLVVTATATGNLEPESEVTVGAEISGLIDEVLVEENDRVELGQVLARFDTEQLEINLELARAQLASARASVSQAQATLEEAEAQEGRKVELFDKNTASQAELDTARAARKRAVAQLASARASVRQAQSSVSEAETRLEKAIITSPIDGVVLQRNVEPGNTVAASLQAPELFLLAQDLRQMELHVALDEADVSLVEAGQPATFTVDAWPERTFDAEVLTVFLYPTIVNNVVTYTTVLGVDNSDSLLRPGMTATATIETGTSRDVLRVPNLALRFSPPRQEDGGGIFSGPPGRGAGSRDAGPSNTVWVMRDGESRRLALSTGRTDGQYTEVLGDELEVGDRVVTGIAGQSKPGGGR
mgnify:FL=1